MARVGTSERRWMAAVRLLVVGVVVFHLSRESAVCFLLVGRVWTFRVIMVKAGCEAEMTWK